MNFIEIFKLLNFLIIIKNIFLCNNFFNICFNNHLCADYITIFNLKNINKKNENLYFLNNIICIKDSIQLFKNYEKYDNEIFNLSLIYSKEIIKNKTIKIVHKGNKNLEKKILCIFGVLENENGYNIEKEMLKWLLPEYDVYCVYQKYPGKLYEYPAIRFAQYIVNYKNINIALYIHTKGAFFPSLIQSDIRNIWKNEYTGFNKLNYINPLKNNIVDVTCILTNKGKITWFNSFFASKKGFNYLDKIKPSNNRYNFESQFSKTNAKILGILDNETHHPLEIISKYIKTKFKIKIKVIYFIFIRYIFLIPKFFLFVIIYLFLLFNFF